MPEDRIILGVLPVQGDPSKELLRYDIHNLDAVHTPRYRLVGFSFFGEVDGTNPTADNRYVHLQDPTENSNQLPTPGCNGGTSNPPLPIIRPYGQWLNDLACRRINFSRVFLFTSEQMTKYFPQDKPNGPYILTQIAQRYVERLTQYILWAKQNSIVVCLTLFNDYMLRVGDPAKPRPADGFFVNPFNDALNAATFNFVTVADTDNDQIIRQKFYRIQPPAGTVDYDQPQT
ncbi:MAG TPA: hypothetical protein VKA60_24390 [Blastocatellia bacterium]|nr:hypothetical protein [Blastocatellia bacterium]